MTDYPTIEDWCFEIGGRICGLREDGKRICTSPVVARNPETNLVQTQSGSIYQLLTHSGEGYAEDLIWDSEGWCGGGIRCPLPRVQTAAAPQNQWIGGCE